jgi:ABC-type Mn2+/Zn2+ transport system permease subunit
MFFAVFSVVTGILTSYSFNIAPGGMIVLISIVIFVVSLGIKSAGLIKNKPIVLIKQST